MVMGWSRKSKSLAGVVEEEVVFFFDGFGVGRSFFRKSVMRSDRRDGEGEDEEAGPPPPNMGPR